MAVKMKTDVEKLKDVIRSREKDNRIVIEAHDGLMDAYIDDFIKQPLEGMLYDLNRLPEVTMTMINNPKWINDYAVYLVIKKLKEFYDAHQEGNNG
jgi:hypothetical protein